VNIANDRLLELVFSNYNIWEQAIIDGDEKAIKHSVLKNVSDPIQREELKQQLIDHTYHIKPPHEAHIPKDDGTMRTVYANEADDRVLLTVINNIFFKYCPEMIHHNCVSYQTGIGCGKIDKAVVNKIRHTKTLPDKLGYKIDLSKYFDSVPIEYIDKVFDDIEHKFGPSCILDLVREYYHDDTLLDIDRNEIHKYTSLRQGCAIAAFLANAVLFDIDKTISKYNVVYCRYSDDILIIGVDADIAYFKISEMLNARSLVLNPKKIEILTKDKWFTFLGFSIRGQQITLSKKRIKNLQHEIEKRTIKRKNKKKADIGTIIRSVYIYLYDTAVTKYGYADGILPIINCDEDIRQFDLFIMDCIRASITGKTRIGGLGYDKNGKNGVITRGKGRHVHTNREKIPHIKNYTTLKHMQNLFINDREAYTAYVKELIVSPIES